MLLFKENVIKNTSLLTKCNNPCIGIKHTTNEYKNAFKELSNIGLGKLEKKTSKNNTEFLTFSKILHNEICKSVETMDKWPNKVSIKDYDKLFTLDEKRKENESSRNHLELSTDPIEE